ncbi:Galactosyl transferase GMA12/MNN10 family protein [Perilla frutescens var. hirtella]|nr:Galactosyl transferase GMA12/MNN10 family protein [Perilla frutescens var. hirtella]
MAKPILSNKPSSCSRLWIAAAATVLIFFPLLTFTDPWLRFSSIFNPKTDAVCRRGLVGRGQESKDPTFYDEPESEYSIDKAMIDWDRKRSDWLKLHPTFASSDNRVLVVTGSQSSSCTNPLGDHFLLRFFKNKVDYCRIHGYEIFYNNGFLHPKMRSYWAKIPIIRAAMVAHPQVEWLFWVDSDAIFTDMDFKIPFERYKDHNLVVHGWPDMIFEKKSWVAANAGVFLIRNCQWSMDFLDVWAGMGPKSPNFQNWGKILRSTLKDKLFPESDDQSALIYIILKGKKKWRDMIYVENRYALHGYWIGIVGRFEDIAERYVEMEKGVAGLRRRHAEAVSVSYAAERERYAEEGGGRRRRPFITHFTGCQPCSGEHNPAYEGDSCTVGMERALNFADNQVLRNYGFVHPDLGNSSLVIPLPFDYRGGGVDQFI